MISKEVYDKIREALGKDLSQYGLAGVFRSVAAPIPGFVPHVDSDSKPEEVVYALICLSYWKAYIAHKYLRGKVDRKTFWLIMNAMKIFETEIVEDEKLWKTIV